VSTSLENALAKGVEVTGRGPLPIRVDYTQAIAKHRFDLLYSGNALIALIETVPVGDHLLIERVAVAPNAQGRGFGKRLMNMPTNSPHQRD
jgi:GNAT superfamily N-acetyltransferase